MSRATFKLVAWSAVKLIGLLICVTMLIIAMFELVEGATQNFPTKLPMPPFNVTLYVDNPKTLPEVRVLGWLPTPNAARSTEDPGNHFYIQVFYPASKSTARRYWTLCTTIYDKRFNAAPIGYLITPKMDVSTHHGIKTFCYAGSSLQYGYVSPTSGAEDFDETSEAYSQSDLDAPAVQIQGPMWRYGITTASNKSRYIAPGISDDAQFGRDYEEPTGAAIHFTADKRAYYTPNSERKLVVVENFTSNSAIINSSPQANFTGYSVYWQDQSIMDTPWVIYSNDDELHEQLRLVLAGVFGGLAASLLVSAFNILSNVFRIVLHRALRARRSRLHNSVTSAPAAIGTTSKTSTQHPHSGVTHPVIPLTNPVTKRSVQISTRRRARRLAIALLHTLLPASAIGILVLRHRRRPSKRQ